MKADDLENHLVRVFNGKAAQWYDEIYWFHGATRYRAMYWLTHIRGPESFVKQISLTDVTNGVGRERGIGMEFFDHHHTVEDAAKWVAKKILVRDAT